MFAEGCFPARPRRLMCCLLLSGLLACIAQPRAGAAVVMGAWQAAAAMPAARAQATAVTDPTTGYIYVAGGASTVGGESVTTVQRFDPRSGTWSEVASLPTAARGAAGAYADGKIYL